MATVSGIGRVYAAVQSRNCSSQLYSIRSYSSELSSVRRLQAQSISAMVTTVTPFSNPIIANGMPTISIQTGAAFNYKYHSRSYYHNDHILMSLCSPGMAFHAFSTTSLNNKNDMVIDDDYSNCDVNVDKKKWPEVFLKALERAGVTDITIDLQCCKTVNYALDNHFKSIKRHYSWDRVSALYDATGFAAADRGDKDRPGVCVTSANSGILAQDALVKCHRLGKNLPVVCIIGSSNIERLGRIEFNDEPLTSLPHYYRIMDVRDITTVVQQAFSSAYNEGGPVFIDIQHLIVDDEEVITKDWDFDVEYIVSYIKEVKGDYFFTMYVSSSWDGDGVGNANGSELSRFVELTGIPVTRSLVGLAMLSSLVLYLGATSDDLPDILALDASDTMVFPVDVGDDEMTKIIKKPIHIPTLKEINEMLQRENITPSVQLILSSIDFFLSNNVVHFDHLM